MGVGSGVVSDSGRLVAVNQSFVGAGLSLAGVWPGFDVGNLPEVNSSGLGLIS